MFKESTMRVYSEVGFCLFPCLPGQKVPAIKDYYAHSTCDLDSLKMWLRREPQYNFACDAGKSRLLVLDVDYPEGYESLAFVEDVFGKLPLDSLVQGTPSGGMHIVFRLPFGVSLPSKPRLLGNGLEVKSSKGQFMVAPSVVDNGYWGEYVWLTHTPVEDLKSIKEAPKWLLDFMMFSDANPQGLFNKASRDFGVKSLANFVARQGRDSGNRNNALFWAACQARDNGVSLDEALSVLVPAALSTGLGDKEANATVRSAFSTKRR